MAIIPGLSLSELRQGRAVVDDKGAPTDELLRIINGNSTNTRKVVNRIATVLETIIDLNDLITAAQDAVNATEAQNEIANSYVSGLTITATDAGSNVTITISAHSRHYPQSDGSLRTVAVTGGTLMGQPYSTAIWVYYDQASRLGGAVTYAASLAPVAQLGNRHSVGAVTTPAAAGSPVGGRPVRPPGYVEP